LKILIWYVQISRNAIVIIVLPQSALVGGHTFGHTGAQLSQGARIWLANGLCEKRN